MNQDKQLKRNIIWNMVGTTCNTIVSIAIMIVVTRINGLDDAGVYTFAFSNACVLWGIGVYMGRTYQLSDKINSDQAFIWTRIFTCLVMVLISLVMCRLYHYSVGKSIIFVSWTMVKMLEAFADVLYGVMQKNDRLDYVGKSFAMKAMAGFSCFMIIDIIIRNLTWASVGLLAVNAFIVIVYDFPHCFRYQIVKRDHMKTVIHECRFLLRDGFFIFGVLVMSTYLVNASKYAINSLGTSREQAIFSIIIMPATVMLVVGQYLIQPFLLKISNIYESREMSRLFIIIMKMVLVFVGIGIAGLICVYTIGIPILNFVYGTKLNDYKMELVVVIVGAVAYGTASILMNILTIMHCNKMQFICMCIDCTITFAIANVAVEHLGIMGACLTYLLSMMINAVMFSTIVMKKMKEGN